MNNTRWFISYRYSRHSIMNDNKIVKYSMIVTDVTPAQWVREHTVEHHIQYAEKISTALASELVHCGSGVLAEYFCEGG